jgi:hypothetical protein
MQTWTTAQSSRTIGANSQRFHHGARDPLPAAGRRGMPVLKLTPLSERLGAVVPAELTRLVFAVGCSTRHQREIGSPVVAASTVMFVARSGPAAPGGGQRYSHSDRRSASPSSSGLGLRPFKAAARVRIPLGIPALTRRDACLTRAVPPRAGPQGAPRGIIHRKPPAVVAGRRRQEAPQGGRPLRLSRPRTARPTGSG